MKIELNVTLTAVDKFYSYMKRVRAHDKNEEYFKSPLLLNRKSKNIIDVKGRSFIK